MTNGEKFKQIFPNYQIDMGELYVYVWLPNHDAVDIPHEWWDAEYREPITKNDLAHNLCDSCTNIGCEFQSGIVRTECAFYMPPHIEPDNCGNYVVQEPTTKNDLGVDTDKLIADCEKMSFDFELFGRPTKALLLDAVKNIVKELPLVTPQEMIYGKCNQCKYYEGVHNVQGHAPCSYHKIGGVMWNWYCSQFESGVEV